jgi:hypothetical protein
MKEFKMQRTIVLVHQRFVHNDESFKVAQIGKIDCHCLPHATELLHAINSTSTHGVTAELAFPLYLHNKVLLVPVDALMSLVDNLCVAGLIDRDSLPEAESVVAAQAAQTKQEALAAEQNAERNNGQRKPFKHDDDIHTFEDRPVIG